MVLKNSVFPQPGKINIFQTINKIRTLNYLQRFTPAGVQRTLETENVVVKDVDVEMDVVVIQ